MHDIAWYCMYAVQHLLNVLYIIYDRHVCTDIIIIIGHFICIDIISAKLCKCDPYFPLCPVINILKHMCRYMRLPRVQA